jgi:hypothetical protein
MTTISGTPISAPSTVLLGALATTILNDTLGDPTEANITKSQVETWLKDGIKRYTQRLKRSKSTIITTTLNGRKYDLPTDFEQITSVEYPTGETIPCYLEQQAYTDGNFWAVTGLFDIIYRNDDSNPDELWISEEPTAGQTITVEYLAEHDYTLTTSEAITVPQVHHNLLKDFAFWRATLYLQSLEQITPTSNSSLLQSILAQDAGILKRSFEEDLKAAARGREPISANVTWREPEELSRIY